MENERVLCASSAYEEKFYLNERFSSLPTSIKEELHIMCVLFTTDVGGILTLSFDEDGSLYFNATANEEDLLYDEIGSVLLVKKLQHEKEELLEGLEQYYKSFFIV